MELDVSIARKTLRTASGQTRSILHDVAFSLRKGRGLRASRAVRLRQDNAFADRRGPRHRFRRPDRLAGRAQDRHGISKSRGCCPGGASRKICSLVGTSSDKDLDEIVAALRLSRHLDHFPGELSLGLARRVAIARAFAVKPDLLLLDEPFVSLDAALAVRLREELLALVIKRKATTLIVTHDVEEAIAIADRIIVLSAAARASHRRPDDRGAARRADGSADRQN